MSYVRIGDVGSSIINLPSDCDYGQEGMNRLYNAWKSIVMTGQVDRDFYLGEYNGIIADWNRIDLWTARFLGAAYLGSYGCGFARQVGDRAQQLSDKIFADANVSAPPDVTPAIPSASDVVKGAEDVVSSVASTGKTLLWGALLIGGAILLMQTYRGHKVTP